MSINRTREQKQQAAIKRMEPMATPGSITLRVGSEDSNKVYSSQHVLPVTGIKKDLARTIVITLIAILVQGVIFGLLSRGIIKIPGV